jgi:hypothetical protein
MKSEVERKGKRNWKKARHKAMETERKKKRERRKRRNRERNTRRRDVKETDRKIEPVKSSDKQKVYINSVLYLSL